MVICLEKGAADLHMAQVMPLPLTVSCFSKIQFGFTFLVPAHLSSPGQRAVKRVCVLKNVLQLQRYKKNFSKGLFFTGAPCRMQLLPVPAVLTKISCRRGTHAKRCLSCIILYAEVTAQCDTMHGQPISQKRQSQFNNYCQLSSTCDRSVYNTEHPLLS